MSLIVEELLDDKCNFYDLPEPVQLYIFNFLDCITLLKAAQVCQTWNRLCTDNLLWKHKLENDMMKWNVIGHTFNPNSLRQISEPDYKQIYMACSPLMRKNKITLLGKISKAFQYVVNRKVPKLAMFGPGLESGGTRLVINLLQDYTNTFKFISLFPGRFEGIGSGITLNLSSHSLEFNLITLYTATQNEREHRSAEKRALQNRLFVQENPGQNQSKLQRAIKDLCRTLDGLIYVVHASCPQDELVLGLPELLALSNEVLIPSHVPLLVLSCATAQDTFSRSSVEMAKELQLLKLNRPWQVHNCRVDGMLGIEDAFKWIIETSRNY